MGGHDVTSHRLFVRSCDHQKTVEWPPIWQAVNERRSNEGERTANGSAVRS
jgi:hypothetical protein